MSKYDELEKLHGLKEKGILTEEEFEAEKQKILSREQERYTPSETAYSSNESQPLNKDLLTFLHASCIAGVILPVIGLVIPFILWQTNKQHAIVEKHGRMLLNWCGSSLIYFIAGLILAGIQYQFGAFVLAIITLGYVGFCIYGAIKASNKELYRYPLAIPFIPVDNGSDGQPPREKIQI